MLSISPLPVETRNIAGASVLVLSRAQAVQRLERLMAQGGHEKVAFANAHFLNIAADDPEFAGILGEFSVLPDGLGVDIASKLLYGHPFPDNLNGTDFVPHLLAQCASPLKVGLLGAKPGIAEKAATAFAAMAPQHDFTVISHGYMDAQAEQSALAALAAAPVDLLLVAMGNPIQEKWILRHITPAHAHIAMGVGALFDFVSGSVPRAPALVRSIRVEWLWRLIMEPRRMWRRYILGNPAFLWRVMKQRTSEQGFSSLNLRALL